MSTSIMLLKAAASSPGGGEALGHAIKSAGAGKVVGKGIKKVVGGAAGLGGDIAEGLGKSRAVGEAAGLAGLAGGTALGAKKLKDKKDRWMYRHGFAG